jgi:hypothetical protein
MKMFVSFFVVLLIATSVKSQNIVTLKVTEHLTKKPMENIQITAGQQTVLSNERGYAQFSASEGDTLGLWHPDFEEKTIVVPSATNFQATMDRLENKLLFQPGMDKFYAHFSRNLKYPTDLRRKNIESYMIILFRVEESGSSQILETFGENSDGFSEQIPSLFEKLPGTWDSTYAGRTFALPIVFRKHNGKELNAPTLDAMLYDRLFNPIVVTGYDTVR